jgi:hypothetical protein
LWKPSPHQDLIKEQLACQVPAFGGLQSCCSTHQAPALHQIHASLGFGPLGPHGTPTSTLDPPSARIPAPRTRQDTSLHWIHAPPGSPPLRSPAPQALLGSSSMWDHQIHLCRDLRPLAMLGPSSVLDPCPAGIPTTQGQALVQSETAASPFMPGYLPLWPSQVPALQAC